MKYLYFILRLFFSPKCKHNFHLIMEKTKENNAGTGIVGFVYVLQCKKCGKIEHYEI